MRIRRPRPCSLPLIPTEPPPRRSASASGKPHASLLRSLQRPRTLVADFAGISWGNDISTLRAVEMAMKAVTKITQMPSQLDWPARSAGRGATHRTCLAPRAFTRNPAGSISLLFCV